MAGFSSPMIDMELDLDSVVDMATPINIPVAERATYPYGLRICLSEKELAKLGLDASEASKGARIRFEVECCVTSVTCTDGEFGKSERVELQIEKMRCCDDPAHDDAPRSNGHSPLYDRTE